MPTSEERQLPPGHDPKLLESPHDGRPQDAKDRRGGAHDDTDRPKYARKWLYLVIAGMILGMGILFLLGWLPFHHREQLAAADAQRQKNHIPAVNVVQVKHSPAVSQMLLPGNITPLTEAYIYARASGYVKARYADIGDHVRAGQVLATVESPELDQQVAQGRAAVAQSEQQLGQAKAALQDAIARLDLARVTWERYKVLLAHGAVSQQDADQQYQAYRSAEATVNSSRANIGAAEEGVRAARANLQRLISLQSYEQVRAPFTGVVTARNFDIGALLGGSGGSLAASSTPNGGTQQSGTGSLGGPSNGGTSIDNTPSTGGQGGELYRMAQVGILRILVNVPQENAPMIRVGTPASVIVQQYPNNRFWGKVTRTANAIDPASRTLLTEVQVQNTNNMLLPGTYSQVEFDDPRTNPPLLIPGDSIVANAKGLQVAILEELTAQDRQRLRQQEQQENNSTESDEATKAKNEGGESQPQDIERLGKRVHFQPIQVGRDYGQETEVISGLQGWEYVIVNPGDAVEEGAIVLPRNAPQLPGQQGARRGQSDKAPGGITSPSEVTPTRGTGGKAGGGQGASGSATSGNAGNSKGQGGGSTR